MFNSMIKIQPKPKPSQELLKRGLTPTLSTSHQMRPIKPFPLSIVKIWVGKQMFASYRSTIVIMESTVTRKLSN